jgi:hypothetical protein
MPTNSQHTLFAPPVPPQIAPVQEDKISTDPPSASETSKLVTQPKPVTTEELLESVFQYMCSYRRFDRELLLGASDDELGRIFGHAFCMGQGSFDLEFRPEEEPTLIIRESTFKIEVLTLTAAEIAPYIRRIVGVPQPKSDEERRIALAQQFDAMRTEQRRDILSYIRSLIGEKTPRSKTKKKKDRSEPEPLSLGQEIASLLFTPDCLSEVTIRRNLITIARLVARKTDQDTLRATKTAISIIDSANGRWRSLMGYWQDDDNETSSPQVTKPEQNDNSSPP